MTYVIHQRDKQTGKSIGFLKRADDGRKAATFTYRAAIHVANRIETTKGFATEVLCYDDAFGTRNSDDYIIHA